MHPGPALIPCPACGTLSPGDNRFCGKCGQALLVSPAANLPTAQIQYLPTTQLSPAVPYSQPPTMTLPSSGPQSGAASVGRPAVPAPGQSPRRKQGFLSRPAGKIALVALLVVIIIGGGVGGFFWVRDLLRHGLPGDIPLPDNASFIKQTEQTVSGHRLQSWFYTIANTTPEHVAAFYHDQLPLNGWKRITSRLNGPGNISGNVQGLVPAQRLGVLIQVEAPPLQPKGITPPAGGVVLEIDYGSY